jgi:hypothetical protein
LSRVGIYAVNPDGSLTLLAASANDTTFLAAASTTYTPTLTTAVQLNPGSRYAVGVLTVLSAGNPPNLYGAPVPPVAELGLAPRLSSAVTGQTDLPATVAAASLAASGQLPYFALVP